MPEPALLMLATRQINQLMRTNYTMEQVAEMDPVWHVLARVLSMGPGGSLPAEEATE